MRTMPYGLPALLSEAQRRAFAIPRFQRKFEWSWAQTRLLIDSIARNYPIGSLLLLSENNPKAPFLASRSVQAELAMQSDNAAGEDRAEPYEMKYYVLDGQQRLTSIVQVFLQASPEYYFYFDLHRLLNFNDNSDSNDKTNQTNWIIRKKKTIAVTHRYMRTELAMDQQRSLNYIQDYYELEESTTKNDRAARQAATARVSAVFETMRGFHVPLVVIDRREESIEAICRIFETINSTGMRLTTFNLTVARFFPKPDLQQLWDDSLDKHPVLKSYNVDGERVLQVIALLQDFGENKLSEVSRSALLGLKKDVIENLWPTAAQVLADAYQWVEDRGAIPRILANEVYLIPIAAFFHWADNNWKQAHPGFMSILERWYFANCLQQGAKQATNYRISRVSDELRRWVRNGKEPPIPTVFLTPDTLLEMREADNRYKTIHALLRWKGSRDLWTGELLNPNDMQDHHLFPRALAKRENLSEKLLDSIANKLLISTDTNKQLKDRHPGEYMEKIIQAASRQGLRGRQKQLFESVCIPVPDTDDLFVEQFKPAHFKAFLIKRSEMIISMISLVIGDALNTERSPESNENDDDDD